MQPLPDPGYRVDTGAVQIGNDWPGVFMRGDDADGEAMTLIAASREPNAEWVPEYLKGLAVRLRACVVKR